MEIFTKQTKKKFKSLFKTFSKNFEISWEVGSSILGFVLAQFVWIWILKSFLAYFILWFVELTSYNLHTMVQLTKLFWIVYGMWFFMCILLRFNPIKTYTKDE